MSHVAPKSQRFPVARLSFICLFSIVTFSSLFLSSRPFKWRSRYRFSGRNLLLKILAISTLKSPGYLPVTRRAAGGISPIGSFLSVCAWIGAAVLFPDWNAAILARLSLFLRMVWAFTVFRSASNFCCSSAKRASIWSRVSPRIGPEKYAAVFDCATKFKLVASGIGGTVAVLVVTGAGSAAVG